MKVIFLDIDGVLNSDEYIDRAKNTQGIERHIDIEKVKLLKKAINETDAKTVLTSSWRNSKDIGPLRELLAKYEIYFDVTPFINWERGLEIKQWLLEHNRVEDYIILDDEIYDSFDKEMLRHLVKVSDTNGRGLGEGLTQKDIDDITEGIKRGFDYIAASFVRKASDVIALRNLLDSNGGERVKIISKIENQEGIDNFEEILELSDGIMVARGDMGVEIPMEQVPIVQKRFIKRCNQVGKPVITATQMLESMTSNPRPTRAEVSDVANAVYDTTGAIMLSGECAMGKYPVECVQAMSKISKAIEADTNYWKRFNKNATSADFNDIESHVAYTTCVTAQNMKAAGIVAYTHKGDSVRKLAGFGAGCPIFAITDDEKTFNQLSVSFNVVPVLVMGEKTIEDTLCKGIEKIKADELVEAGDVLVISGGSKILPNASENKVFGGMVRI